MKAIAIKIFLKVLRMIGIKKAIRLAWDNVIYPKLMAWAKSNDYPDWDIKMVKFMDDNMDKIIELI